MWYEDLRTDLARTLQLLMDFLKVDFSEKQLQCVLSNTEGLHLWPKTPHIISMDVYTPNVLKTADKYVTDIKTLISELRQKLWYFVGYFP